MPPSYPASRSSSNIRTPVMSGNFAKSCSIKGKNGSSLLRRKVVFPGMTACSCPWSRRASFRRRMGPRGPGPNGLESLHHPFQKGEKSQVLCFSYILGFSRRQYIDFTLRRDFFTLIRRHTDAFQYFGGNPRECLYDGEKTILLRWEAGRPVFNPKFIDFITHYQCRPVACRPGSPKTKGKIEAPFKYVENNLLNAREFYDLEDLRAVARWWMKEKSDRHVPRYHRPAAIGPYF